VIGSSRPPSNGGGGSVSAEAVDHIDPSSQAPAEIPTTAPQRNARRRSRPDRVARCDDVVTASPPASASTGSASNPTPCSKRYPLRRRADQDSLQAGTVPSLIVMPGFEVSHAHPARIPQRATPGPSRSGRGCHCQQPG
jgi:hypothetical protein